MRTQSTEQFIDGIRIESYGTASDSPPLLFVHGGCQGSWAWEKVAPRLAEPGRHAVCLNWYGHHGSKSLGKSRALRRSLLDVRTEIAAVARSLDSAPVLVAHGMGAVPSLAYAAENPVTALVLLAPVLPAGFGGGSIDLMVDGSSMWLPPRGLIKPLWWSHVTDDESRRYASLLVPESPLAILEATRWLCQVETGKVRAPVLVIAGGADPLVPAEVESLAEAIGATFLLHEGEGHGMPLNPVWSEVSAEIDEWLCALN
ncbi:alpha/beta fold hydrolase [Mycobacterium sp. 050134]|uniref:alpha/beta fold hydrolase n=1 Tax=Mycobacterium sp. 050134 TaxID=3096111 RepID=UPI002ED80139